MGIGAGWYEHEWRAYGYGFPSAGERIARLDEGVQIMRQMWTEGIATLHGQQYDVSTARAAIRCRCRPAACRCGSPAAASGRRCGSRPSTRRTRTSTATPEGFQHKSEILAAALLATSAGTSPRSPAAPTTTS